jgi:hypothetical protein
MTPLCFYSPVVNDMTEFWVDDTAVVFAVSITLTEPIGRWSLSFLNLSNTEPTVPHPNIASQ